MNPLTQFKIFKKIPILPLLIPRLHNLLLPLSPQKVSARRSVSEKISIQMIILIGLSRLWR
jgi:hypothetical protein